MAAQTDGRSPASEGVRHQGDVPIASGTGIDLDSPAGEVQWRQDKDLPPGASYDLYMGSGSDRYAAARGSAFCVKTSDVRFSLVRVISEPDQVDGSLQIGATSYESIGP